MKYKPTLREVKVILGEDVSGWNDLRKNGGRIKLLKRATQYSVDRLNDLLPRLFPNYQIRACSLPYGQYMGCLAIYYTERTK